MMIKARAWMLAFLCFSVWSAGAFAADKAWTVLVYLNGFNDLDAEGYLNLNQMETVGSSDEVNFVVEWGSMKHKKSTKRLLIRKDDDFKKVTSPVLQDLGKVDMGDPRTLEEFLLWGVREFPAEHYLVVVWDHGSGWHGVRPALHGGEARLRPTDISWDDVSGNAISTAQLGAVINEVSRRLGRRIDIFSTDACLMAMAEVASEMQNAVDYFAGSEELAPGEGWAYDVLFDGLVSAPGMTPRELGDLIAGSFVKRYQGKEDATYSVFDMSRFAAFENAMGAFAGEIARLNVADRATALKQVRASQSFEGDYVDLGDFLTRIGTGVNVNSAVLGSVRQALQDLVVVNYKTDRYPTAQGLSLWMPAEKSIFENYRGLYSTLSFEKNARWSSAISSYLN